MKHTTYVTFAAMAAALLLSACAAPGPRYQNVSPFSEGVAAVQAPSGKWGFINQRQEWVIEPRFDDAREFRDGRAAARQGRTWGFIDKQGRWQ